MKRQRNNQFNFNEETICGYIVSEKVKRLWAVEMDLAVQLNSICEKYGIKYYAAGGTLLGAVRHKGFIPWDDDMDFLMMQEDYDKFCVVAPLELKEPYCFQQSFSISRIRNSNTTGCTKVELKNAIPPFNLGIFIDIFPLSALPDNIILRYLHKIMLYIMRAARRGERRITLLKYYNNLTWKNWVDYKVVLWKLITLCGEKNMIKRHMRLCSKFNHQNTKELGITSFIPYNERYVWKREWFGEKRVTLPFEYISVPVPYDYDAYLRKSYGDYNKFVKNGAQHSMPIFDPDKPFMQYIERIKNEQRSREANENKQ